MRWMLDVLALGGALGDESEGGSSSSRMTPEQEMMASIPMEFLG